MPWLTEDIKLHSLQVQVLQLHTLIHTTPRNSSSKYSTLKYKIDNEYYWFHLFSGTGGINIENSFLLTKFTDKIYHKTKDFLQLLFNMTKEEENLGIKYHIHSTKYMVVL